MKDYSQEQIAEFIRDWISWLLNVKGLSKNTGLAYKADILNLLQFLKSYKSQEPSLNTILKLNKVDFRSWLFKRKQDQLISARSNARAVSAVKSFFLYLNYNLDINNKEIFDIKIRNKKNHLPKALSFEEIENVMLILEQNCKKKWIAKRNIALFYLLYGCGLRISEALLLKVQDIENSNAKVTGKGNRERIIHLLKPVLKSLRDYIKICPYITNKSCPIFFSQTGKTLSRTAVASYLVFLRKKFCLTKHLSPHSFRHSFATHLLQNNLDIRKIQELLGHKSLTSTEIYTKMTPRALLSKYKQFTLR